MKKPGTTVILVLNQEGLKIDADAAIRHYVKGTPVPIYLGKDATEPLHFDWTPADLELQELASQFRHISKFRFVLDNEYEDSQIWIRHYRTVPFFPLQQARIAKQGFLVERKYGPEDLPIPSAGLTLINAKRDILDLDISREHVKKDTPKWRVFLDKYIRVLMTFARRDYEAQKPTSLMDQVVAYHLALEKYNISPGDYHFAQRFRSPLVPSYAELLHGIPILVLTLQGLRILSAGEISRMKPSTIKFFPLHHPREVAEEEISIVTSRMKDDMNQREAIVFTEDFDDYGFYERLFKWVLEDKLPAMTDLTWADIFGAEFAPIDIPLDDLLPDGGRFARLPAILRGLVIPVSPWVVQTDKEYFDYESNAQRVVLVALGMARAGTHPDLKIVKTGTLLFDADDDFNGTLIRAEHLIKSSDELQGLVTNYFKLLAYANLPHDADEELLEFLVENAEQEILHLMKGKLPISKIERPNSRWSKIWEFTSRGLDLQAQPVVHPVAS